MRTFSERDILGIGHGAIPNKIKTRATWLIRSKVVLGEIQKLQVRPLLHRQRPSAFPRATLSLVRPTTEKGLMLVWNVLPAKFGESVSRDLSWDEE